MLVCFPGLRFFFRLLFRFAPSHKLIKIVHGNLRTVLEERRANRQDTVLVDALHLLVEASEGRHMENRLKQATALLTDDEIIWNAYVFLLAGYETTSTALSYVTHCLSLHAHIQEKVYEEVETEVGLEGPIAFEDLSKLMYMVRKHSHFLKN